MHGDVEELVRSKVTAEFGITGLQGVSGDLDTDRAVLDRLLVQHDVSRKSDELARLDRKAEMIP